MRLDIAPSTLRRSSTPARGKAIVAKSQVKATLQERSLARQRAQSDSGAQGQTDFAALKQSTDSE